MRKYFTRIAWGLLFALLDFRINAFDLLPDALGYGMIFFALDELAKSSPGYRVPSAIAKLLTAGAALELLPGFVAGAGDPLSWQPLLYSNAMLLLKLYWVFTFLLALERHAEGAATEAFLATAAARRWFYTAVAGATLVAMPFAINWPEAQQPFAVFFAFMGMLAEALIVLLCFRAAKEWPEEKTPTPSA